MKTDTAGRMTRAQQSAGRAAGYCWLEHPKGRRFCTRRPHADQQHIDHYRGRRASTDAQGTAWVE
ncbi:hypothetical protein [Streptomyces shenzhenensis]|uniref:Uncharacterized protein n=1 Tax=Streptomyces shenzhenensis TaxID=943815 RepID=A0A3M0I8R9_9ACTN|nr:hypothetical protein [Streptomyces shenzhenensis]RMB85637.1 hypothetical protein CTZ28_12685 [Streptomyces shenzhenensis]